MVLIEYQGYNIHYGRNAKENWAILDNAEDDDIWFHINDFPSAHIILEVKNMDSMSDDIYEYCCKLCIERTSKVKSMKGKIKVIYTKRSNLEKGKVVGEVYISNISNVNGKWIYNK
jgi:predicted ribosome quality control (RQC) complex YloA/Tae2 family protein